MTTIAIKDGLFAADSRCTDTGGGISTRVTKIFRLENKALFGFSGDADTRDVVALLNKATPKKMPSRAELAATRTECGGLLVFPNGTIYFIDISEGDAPNDWHASVVECRERFAAAGSGMQYAMGAMAAGRTAKQAVEIACRFDSSSGPPVIEVELKITPKPPRPKTPTKKSTKK